MKFFVESHTILKNRSGVGWFTHGLVKGMQRVVNASDSIFLITHPKEQMDIADLLEDSRTIETPIDWLPPRLYHTLKHQNRMPPLDLIYGKGTYIFPNFIRWPMARSPSVIVVHDLSMFVCPEYLHPENLSFMTRHLPNSVRKADLIIAVSESSKKTLCEHFSVNPDNVLVTPLAAEPTLYFPRTEDEIANTKAKYGIFGRYLLFVSTLEPRKNVEGLIRAFRALPRAEKEQLSLVLVGGRGWQDDAIRAAIQEARLAGDKVVLPGYVDTTDLPSLYSGAEAFVFPSHYEGFGLPVLEAMSCGTPVLTANNSSLPEAAGDAALYITAENQEELNAGLQRIVTNDTLRKELRQKGLKQAKKFSWDKSAKIVVDGIHERFGA